MFKKVNALRVRYSENSFKKLRNLKKYGFRRILPTLYIAALLFGVILTILYSFIHSLVTCSSIFGAEFCTATGIFVALLASLPGYLIAGNLLSFIAEVPWAFSFAVVILTSIVFYYFLGLLIDKLKKRKLEAEGLSKLIIVAFFLFLVFMMLMLL